MTGHVDTEHDRGDHRRFARIETAHEDAAVVAAAIAPDNTADVETETDDTETNDTGGVVRTSIRRETTGGLQSTVDDYVVNLIVAARLSGIAAGHVADGDQDGRTASTERTRTQTTDTHHE